MLKFCTLFNSTYLSRGLAMYHSLEQHCESFHLYIVAFDDYCYDALTRLRLAQATIISLNDFENQRLLAIKTERTAGEYCWTCASSTIKYCIEKYQLDHCTYVDADLLFFNDPSVLIDEMGGKSVLITEHRYTTCYDQSATSGIYCVQFMTFKNTTEGMEVLNWWVDACINWCFNRFEDGKFGDQKYLDDWTSRFDCIHVLQHLGGGVAPWNIQQYQFKSKSKKIKGEELKTGKTFDLVFYHYHGFHYIRDNSYTLSCDIYKIDRNQVKHIYRPYSHFLSRAARTINAYHKGLATHETTNDISFLQRKQGRLFMFLLRGYYKNFYTKNALQYGFLS